MNDFQPSCYIRNFKKGQRQFCAYGFLIISTNSAFAQKTLHINSIYPATANVSGNTSSRFFTMVDVDDTFDANSFDAKVDFATGKQPNSNINGNQKQCHPGYMS